MSWTEIFFFPKTNGEITVTRCVRFNSFMFIFKLISGLKINIGIWSPGGPARSESLYRLSYSGSSSYLRANFNFSVKRTLSERSSQQWHSPTIVYGRHKVKPSVCRVILRCLNTRHFGKLLQSNKLNFPEPKFLLVMQRGASLHLNLWVSRGSSYQDMCYGYNPSPN